VTTKIATTAPTAEELTEVALRKILDDAVMLSRDPEWDKRRVYEVGKASIRELYPTSDEYERAIRLLAETLNI
jgi:hypothetical protein